MGTMFVYVPGVSSPLDGSNLVFRNILHKYLCKRNLQVQFGLIYGDSTKEKNILDYMNSYLVLI